MTTMILQAVGSTLASGVSGFTGGSTDLLGGSVSTLMSGMTPDRQVTHRHDGAHLSDMPSLLSTEGAPIPRLYGRARLGGTLIWATRFREVITQTTTETTTGGSRGGLGGKGGTRRSAATTTTTTIATVYSYYGNFAIAVCEGPVGFVRRIWADGQLLDWSGLTIRFYKGDDRQNPDPLIVAKEGADQTPAYRGTAYLVFENFPLTPYGNRIPQFSFEIIRPVAGIATQIRSVNLIPGAGEFIYATMPVSRDLGAGSSVSENRQDLSHACNFIASLEALQSLCPNLKNVQLVVSWFGDDLRCDLCQIAPRVDQADKSTIGMTWRVAGLTRAQAQVTSLVNGVPAYGGTPSDEAVVQAIAELKARGLGVTLYPFVMMDIPSQSGKADPWTGASSQPAYPWRGRLTCQPAPQRAGSPDGTPAATIAVAKFFGAAKPADFSYNTGVVYGGTPEWSLRRMVLHYAVLAKAAGGVDGFILGSEFVALNHISSGAGVYPAPLAFAALANDVRGIVGAVTKLVYAADWTEYGGYSPQAGELRFPLDVLWSHASIDAIGIDAYWPVSDWREGTNHKDYALTRTLYDRNYLVSRMTGGEAYDWYYASDADRASQNRLPVNDGAYNKPWVWRAKDLYGWWSHAHFERVNGVEMVQSTGWQPQSKPIWLTEIGCPAVDKGANAPNLFPDAKSSAAALPYASNGSRDDMMALRYTEAVLRAFDSRAGAGSPANPLASKGLTRMVDEDHISFWCYDARPYPAFPQLKTVWADAANFSTGHWLNGRLESVPLEDLLRAMLADYGLPAPASCLCDEVIDGFVIDRPMSLDAAFAPIADLFALDVIAAPEGLMCLTRGRAVQVALCADDFVPFDKGGLVALTRGPSFDVPNQLGFSYSDFDLDYRRALVSSRRLAGGSKRLALSDQALVMSRAQAQRIADLWLQDRTLAIETASFQLGLLGKGLEPGDIVALPVDGAQRAFLITSVQEGVVRQFRARAVDPDKGAAQLLAISAPQPRMPLVAGRPWVEIFDLPLATGQPEPLQAIAAYADPWPGSLTVWQSVDGTSFTPFTEISTPARMGRTLTALPAGPVWRWDDANSVTFNLNGGVLSSPGDLGALAGNIMLLLKAQDGSSEVIAFASAELIGANQWRVRRLLRGLGGSEDQAARGLPAGAVVVVLDGAVQPLLRGASHVGETWIWRIAPANVDPSDALSVAITATSGPAALLPMPPVGVSAKRTPDGIFISWIRRARLEADSWAAVDIPLDESSEAYRITVLKGTASLRQSDVPSATYLYTAANERADFGAPQTSLTLRLQQVSASVGAGRSVTLTLPII